MRPVFVLLIAAGCHTSPEATPLGMPLLDDGVTYAGAAVIDVTPEIAETFTDLNGNHDFDGCLDNPTGEGCANGNEPFDDVDGDGWFDATFIGGFGPMRPANGVHDGVYARAVVVAHDRQYLAIVALDFVGLGSPRIHDARARLMFEGFEKDRLIVSSSHNHQGPDTMGLWGYPYDFANPVSGTNEAYQEAVTDAIEAAVRQAAGQMEPVELRVGRVAMRDRGPWFNGATFGGKNPDTKMHGMIHDGRDPVVVSDQLLVLQGTGAGGETVFTLTNWSGHPEVRGSSNNEISSDWVGVTREVIEDRYGGVALHVPESLGGMQSALGGELPLVEPDGTHVLSGEVDADGDDVPVWAPKDSWEFVTSHGWHIGEAAIDALEAGEGVTASPITVQAEELYVPIENLAYQILGPAGIFDLGLEDAVFDPAVCPEAGLTTDMGCIETRTFQIRIGPIGFVAVPGELLPELAWGLPDADDAWQAEVDDPASRGLGARYFPQHDPDCNDIAYSDCVERESVGDCDCLHVHAWPYTLSPDPSTPPLLDLLDTEYRAVIGMADNYMSYIIPEPDFNRRVSLLSENDGDHYEDTVSPAHNFATRIQEAQLRISARE